jgi:glycosyltransferase involved in cell wall biosynthesis
MDRFFNISVIVPTRNRAKDLAELLATVCEQDVPPYEVIIVDGSQTDSTRKVADSFVSRLESVGCRTKYILESGDGLTSARNQGEQFSSGDAIMFVDDDTLLDRTVIKELANFLKDRPIALGVQPMLLSPVQAGSNQKPSTNFEDAFYKALMLSYNQDNKMAVRRSGWSIFPRNLTKIISVQRLFGCGCCYRREVFDEQTFDGNLKLWGYLEDLDFSYALYKKNPQSLYAIPHARLIHKKSLDNRLPMKQSVSMMTVYSFYVFFKDVFQGSIINLLCFLYALIGYTVSTISGLVIKRRQKSEWWILFYLLHSYVQALSNLRQIISRNLDFFNRTL